MSTERDSTDREITFEIPKYLDGENHASILIQRIERIFSFKKREVDKILYDLSKVKKLNLFTVLILYKSIEYMHSKMLAKNAYLKHNDTILSAWKKYGFYELTQALLAEKSKKRVEQEFKRLQISVSENLIIAPQPLARGINIDKSLKEEFLPRIDDFYKDLIKEIKMIFTCFSEVFLNYWAHADDETKSIIMVSGNQKQAEIICADTGVGIITTLKRNQKYNQLESQSVIMKSIEKEVTSKEMTNHMGCGLWLVDQICKKSSSKLMIISEGFLVKSSLLGTFTEETGYWKGTIIRVQLNLDNPVTSCDVLNTTQEIEEIGINWK